MSKDNEIKNVNENIIDQLPEKTRAFIRHYFKLNIYGINVATPYFRNVKRVRAELRSKVGKGTPEEIEQELLIYAKLKGFNLDGKTSNEIREFMRLQGLGIDCSGFVSHVLNFYLKEIGQGSLLSNLKFQPGRSIYKRIVTFLRPIEHVGADLLTSDLNCKKIDLKNIKPADLLRLKGIYRGDHIALIISTERDSFGVLKKIKYVHSTQHYGKDDGVRVGEVEIIDENKPLQDQIWKELDENGNCPTLEQLKKDLLNNGIRRLNNL